MTPTTNLFANIPQQLPRELVQVLVENANVRIERIVSHGHASPEDFWYDQEMHEWVVLLQGAARVQFESEEPFDLKPGGFLNIPAHRRHRVVWTEPTQQTIWLALYYR